MEPKISLCIPTMNRFDTFLDNYLEIYLEYKNKSIIDEIIVCDETGEDYEKILKTYNHGNINEPIRLFKNEMILGTFENKRNAILHAKPENFIALIDSDNFADEDYFEVVKKYIIERKITPDMPVVLAPILCNPYFEFSYFNNKVIDAPTAGHYIPHNIFETFLNTGNFVTTRVIDEKIQYKKSDILDTIDVIQKHLWAFQQIPEYRIHGVQNLGYFHNIHEDSYFLKNSVNDETKQHRINIVNAFKAFI